MAEIVPPPRSAVDDDELARLAERARLIKLCRRIVREVAAAPTVAAAAEPMSELLCEAFGAVGLRLRFFDSIQPVHVYATPGRVLVTATQLHSVAYLSSRRLWQAGQCAILGVDQAVNSLGSADVHADLAANDLSSVLLMPIGAGEECLASIALLRDASAPAWTTAEYDAALELGRDLGRAFRQSRARDRERQLIRELSALDHYRSGLIQTIAERLRGPLDAIDRTLGSLAAEGAQDDRAAIDSIHQDAEQMVRVVDDLLYLARLGHPDHREESHDVDLKAVVRRVLGPMTAAAGRSGLTINAHLPARPVVMRGIERDIERMLVELLSNAVTYTPAGGRIVLRLGLFGDSAILDLSDTGIGIPADELDHVFADFFRGNSPEVARTGGCGLGLSIVERIVQRHRGQVELSSKVGHGTTVSIALPLDAELHEHTNARSASV
jgi:signal transduction histidine kinase